MNCEVFQLKELEAEPFELREVLRCILHTIFFHRALGLVRPKDIGLELFDNITYVQCGEVEIEKKIEEKIDQFIDRAEKESFNHPNKKNQVRLSFYQVDQEKQGKSWFLNKVDRLCWERWYVNLSVVQHPMTDSERVARRKVLESSLREVMFQIIGFVNEKTNHVPPIPNVEGISFPYEIDVSSSSDSLFGMDTVKRMFKTGHPTMLS